MYDRDISETYGHYLGILVFPSNEFSEYFNGKLHDLLCY